MTEEEREAQIRALLPLVRKIARRISRLVPCDYDDLVGDGSIGLIRAVDNFDPTRGTSLEHYARHLISGAMLNGIRRMDPVSERTRRAMRDGELERYALAGVRGSIPTMAEMEERRPGFIRASAAVTHGVPLSLDRPLPEGERLQRDWSNDPARLIQARSERDAIDAAVDALPQRQRQVIREHYYGDVVAARGRSSYEDLAAARLATAHRRHAQTAQESRKSQCCGELTATRAARRGRSRTPAPSRPSRWLRRSARARRSTSLLPRDHPKWARDAVTLSQRAREIVARLRPVIVKILTFWDHRVRSAWIGGSRVLYRSERELSHRVLTQVYARANTLGELPPLV